MQLDRITTEQRSHNMRAVKQKNTKPEMVVRQMLHRLGYRFRVHQRNLPGTPDVVLARHKTVVFVHGCFWHGHEGCTRATLPTTRTDFWRLKQERNQLRDVRNHSELSELGYRIVVIWECELKNRLSVEQRLMQIGQK